MRQDFIYTPLLRLKNRPCSVKYASYLYVAGKCVSIHMREDEGGEQYAQTGKENDEAF